MSSEDSASTRRWEHTRAHFPAPSNNEGSDGSVGDPTPDSTFSAAKNSTHSTPASSFCDQDFGEPDLSTPKWPWAPDSETAIEDSVTHGQPFRSPSVVSRLLFSRKESDPKSSRPVENSQPVIPHDAVVLPIPCREKMYPFRGAPGLFVGYEDQVRPPPKQVERWEKDIEPRFWTDASEFHRKLSTTRLGSRHPPGISLELRMSGYASNPHSTHVALIPRIWVLYDHDRWKKQVKKFVQELEWLNHEGFGPVEIRRGSPRLATMNPLMLCGESSAAPRPRISLARRLVSLSPCGSTTRPFSNWAAMLRHSDEKWNNSRLALTTAHGMLELVWDALMDFEPEDDTDSGQSSPSSDYSGYESDVSSTFGDAPWGEATWPTLSSGTKPQEVSNWEAVEILGVTSFLGSGHLDPGAAMFGSTVPEPPKRDTDFSLLGIPAVDILTNHYSHSDDPQGKKILIRHSESSPFMQSMTPINLDLVFGPDHALKVQLLPGKSQFMVRGVRFAARKVRARAPLGKSSIAIYHTEVDDVVGSPAMNGSGG
ncbi:hypothetical protein QBC34DRAFT_384355 [Podospora aff. communis PSN243]|uniref:Uncharacterized protein n=1 Tax=Podospora aff. communis PSN243 TaxID=3040156 RepID=A0AAV9GAA8_9PEZI|nr:hypothetical protein QBC34DRAFT_384355 [Podospora aff. communis PSN243]